MNIETPPSNESQPDAKTPSALSRTVKSIYDTTSDCFDCMLDFWLNVWDRTCIFCSDAWDWTSEHLCPCANRQPEYRSRNKFITNNMTDLKDVNNNDRILSGGNPLPEYVQIKASPSHTQNNKLISQPINVAPSPDTTIRSNLTNPSTGSLENANKLTTSPGVNENKQSSTTPPTVNLNLPKQVTQAHTSDAIIMNKNVVIKVLPPKIDFVETGSIFGDRKRQTPDHNMVLVENGRFRSPGMPKIVRGPGGRPIRVSFVTGFPSIKSVESKNSLTAYTSKTSRKSVESLAPTMAQTVKSSDSKKQSVMSSATIKSNKSINSNENERNVDQ